MTHPTELTSRESVERWVACALDTAGIQLVPKFAREEMKKGADMFLALLTDRDNALAELHKQKELNRACATLSELGVKRANDQRDEALAERDRQKVTIEGMAETNARVVAERDALKALCESICGCVGGKYMFYKQRHGVGDKITKMLSGLIDEIDAERARAKEVLK